VLAVSIETVVVEQASSPGEARNLLCCLKKNDRSCRFTQAEFSAGGTKSTLRALFPLFEV